MENQLYKYDGVLWKGSAFPKPFCPKHRMAMEAYGDPQKRVFNSLRCEECSNDYVIPRDIAAEREYIMKKLESRELKNLKVLNLDDEAIPLAEAKSKSKDGKYFVTASLVESKVGKRLVVYVGERGQKDKTQIFVEPEIKRVAFDQNNLHPTDIFLKLEGTFVDGSSTVIQKARGKKAI